MKTTTTLAYYIVYDRILGACHFERERGDAHIDAETIASEIKAQIEEMGLERRPGKVTVTIEVGERQ